MSEVSIPNATDERYVAFCDILGFSDRILREFEKTIELYEAFGSFWISRGLADVESCVYSDAILLTSNSLASIIAAVNGLWFVAQTHSFILRGGIAKGRYRERRSGNSLFVASDALVHAVRLEKSVVYPMVALADNIDVPLKLWVPHFSDARALAAPLLHFRHRNIVNPFSQVWFTSAKVRISLMREESPTHTAKYDWLLALHQAIESGSDLVPPTVTAKLLELGGITRTL